MYQILYQSLHNSTGPPAAKKRSRRRWGGRSLLRHHRFCTRVYIILQGRLPPKKDPQIHMYLKFGRGGFPPPLLTHLFWRIVLFFIVWQPYFLGVVRNQEYLSATPTVTHLSELTEEFSVCTSGTKEENMVDVGKSRHKKMCRDQNCVATTGAFWPKVPTFGCRGDMSPTCRRLSQPSWPTLDMGILLAARAPGYCSRSVQTRRLNSAATHALGGLGGINHRQWLARSVALACPCRYPEGLLFATQKSCLRKS